jgi:hypothetical protein
MAARVNKIRHDDETRKKIKTSQLLNRLQNHALGECEMTATQIRAAEVCLKKVLPDLAGIEHSGEIETRRAGELTDNELASIATRSSAGTASETVDPSQLN